MTTKRSAARRFMTGEADWLRWFMLGMGMMRGVWVKDDGPDMDRIFGGRAGTGKTERLRQAKERR